MNENYKGIVEVEDMITFVQKHIMNHPDKDFCLTDDIKSCEGRDIVAVYHIKSQDEYVVFFDESITDKLTQLINEEMERIDGKASEECQDSDNRG